MYPLSFQCHRYVHISYDIYIKIYRIDIFVFLVYVKLFPAAGATKQEENKSPDPFHSSLAGLIGLVSLLILIVTS